MIDFILFLRKRFYSHLLLCFVMELFPLCLPGESYKLPVEQGGERLGGVHRWRPDGTARLVSVHPALGVAFGGCIEGGKV